MAARPLSEAACRGVRIDVKDSGMLTSSEMERGKEEEMEECVEGGVGGREERKVSREAASSVSQMRSSSIDRGS